MIKTSVVVKADPGFDDGRSPFSYRKPASMQAKCTFR